MSVAGDARVVPVCRDRNRIGRTEYTWMRRVAPHQAECQALSLLGKSSRVKRRWGQGSPRQFSACVPSHPYPEAPGVRSAGREWCSGAWGCHLSPAKKDFYELHVAQSPGMLCAPPPQLPINWEGRWNPDRKGRTGGEPFFLSILPSPLPFSFPSMALPLFTLLDRFCPSR